MQVAFSNFPRIVASQDFCDGQPRIDGTRITVAAILTYMAGGMSADELVEAFPKLKNEDILQALGFAAANFQDRFLPIQMAAA